MKRASVGILFVAALITPANVNASDLQAWFDQTKTMQGQYRRSLPPKAQRALVKNFPEFQPFTFSAEQTTAARGDFNCDGYEDYAVVVIGTSSLLAKSFSKSSQPKNLEALRKEFQNYSYDQPAKVVVALSSPGGFLWREENGSYASNSKTNCGCCNTPKSDLDWIKKNKCDWLYIGCCEKDGSYKIFQKDTIEARFQDGC